MRFGALIMSIKVKWPLNLGRPKKEFRNFNEGVTDSFHKCPSIVHVKKNYAIKLQPKTQFMKFIAFSIKMKYNETRRN